jgi:hypothetical protein
MPSLWPRTPSTAIALVVLLLVQAGLFLAVTEPSFFATDDYHNFHLAQELPVVRYLLSPVLYVYPAPGHRMLTLLHQTALPLNYLAARVILLAFLAGATLFLVQIIRTFARSERPWTVAVAVPLALSVTLVHPVMWMSNGAQVIPSLFFTAVALATWLRSYLAPRGSRWFMASVVAVNAAGLFSLKFLLIPLYLLILRLWILPRVAEVQGGLRAVWAERYRWLALALGPVLFVIVFVASGLYPTSVGAAGPYAEYLPIAWFGGFMPASMLNARLTGEEPVLLYWTVVIAAQIIFWTLAVSTARRSPLAARGWGLFLVAFVTNVAMVAPYRLQTFGLGLAYELRYYPEVVFFLPLALALAVRRPALAEGSRTEPDSFGNPRGQAWITAAVVLYAVSFMVWAPGLVRDWDGVPARAWIQNLRSDLRLATAAPGIPQIIDSETPDYVMPDFLAPYNRVSTVVGLTDVDVSYNELSPRTYVVRRDGHLAEAVFRPMDSLVVGDTLNQWVSLRGPNALSESGLCLRNGTTLSYAPARATRGDRLSIRVLYPGSSAQPASLEVDGAGGVLLHSLRGADRRAELIDLGTSTVRALVIRAPRHRSFCIERVELGSLHLGDPISPRDA